ncbi:DUF63 family protein [Halobellus clavatus]|jgi:uncharacterized membrane protein|uniref:Uncharacterized membrane protein n=1 Tax=Halobellus clavatus TaxID=660517 RepID=A0A1H3F524_9EURY|nr:DUF63 family protein [Halobellus clavatus]SDX86092.1 Uncharacterized membrane protein [Halobellus clavatus]
MAILPEGFTLPPPPYLALLAVAGALVARAAVRRRPAVTTDRILALAPWMVLGSALHVLYVAGSLPSLLRPLAGTPAVYVTVAIAAVATWLTVDSPSRAETVPYTLAGVGGLAAAVAVIAGLLAGASEGTLSPLLPAAGVVVAGIVAASVWGLLTRVVPEIGVTGRLGAFALFAHVLDGISTAIGIDLLGFGERTPLSRIIIEFAAGLPTASLIGAGWLFVLVKIGVAALVVWLFADLYEEAPTQARLLLGFVAAVGLGPAVHNVLLFTISAPA